MDKHVLTMAEQFDISAARWPHKCLAMLVLNTCRNMVCIDISISSYRFEKIHSKQSVKSIFAVLHISSKLNHLFYFNFIIIENLDQLENII